MKSSTDQIEYHRYQVPGSKDSKALLFCYIFLVCQHIDIFPFPAVTSGEIFQAGIGAKCAFLPQRATSEPDCSRVRPSAQPSDCWEAALANYFPNMTPVGPKLTQRGAKFHGRTVGGPTVSLTYQRQKIFFWTN